MRRGLSVAFFPFGVTLSYIKKKTRIQVDVPDDALASGSKPCFGQTKTLAPAESRAFNSLCSSIKWQDHQKKKKRNAPSGILSG
jgi:hypothetical protein